MTAVRYPGYVAGLANFDLNQHFVDHDHVVALDAGTIPTNEVPIAGYWVPQNNEYRRTLAVT